MADGRKSRPTSGLSPSVITQKRTASHSLISSLPPPPPLHYQHKKNVKVTGLNLLVSVWEEIQIQEKFLFSGEIRFEGLF